MLGGPIDVLRLLWLVVTLLDPVVVLLAEAKDKRSREGIALSLEFLGAVVAWLVAGVVSGIVSLAERIGLGVRDCVEAGRGMGRRDEARGSPLGFGIPDFRSSILLLLGSGGKVSLSRCLAIPAKLAHLMSIALATVTTSTRRTTVAQCKTQRQQTCAREQGQQGVSAKKCRIQVSPGRA